MRLDEFLTARDGYELRVSVSLIMTGKVLVDDRPETRPGRGITEKNVVIVREPPRDMPARSGEKLRGAIEEFGLVLNGRICLDIGAAHGGFTSVLLDAGAARVYAVDVARGMLDFSLRRRDDVVALDRHNIREIRADWFTASDLLESPWFVVCDVSFLSLSRVLEVMAGFARGVPLSFDGVFLLKPQFEASQQTEKGILRDEGLRDAIVERSLDAARSLGYDVRGCAPARLRGRKGNQEYCLYLAFNAS